MNGFSTMTNKHLHRTELMEKYFLEYLKLSEELRSGYINSLLPVNQNWRHVLEPVMHGDIPDLFRIIYTHTGGTKYETAEQKYMDFTPGFLLIHIDEWVEAYHTLAGMRGGQYYPVLRNYSSDFIAMNKTTGEICEIFHDYEDIDVLYKDACKFLQTLTCNYKDTVYFTDEDGFLDYDADKEFETALRLNPDVEYWQDDF